MYYRANGEFIDTGNEIYFINRKTKFAREIECENRKLLKKVISLLTGTIHIDRLAYELRESSIYDLLIKFEEQEIITSYSRPKFKIGLTTQNISSDILSRLHEQTALSEVTEVVDLGSLDKNSLDLVVAIDYDENMDWFISVQHIAIERNIPWIKVSIDDPYIHYGPLFTTDGGPCYECLLHRLNGRAVNSSRRINTFGYCESVIPFFLERQLLKYIHGVPLELFNKEYSFNTNTLEATNFRVLVVPGCSCLERNNAYG